MNTEAIQESNEAQTTGERLRHAREQLGLSQQVVAERLCLKVSTVRDIEEDNAPADLASTFLRGYVRSYARLVHIPEEELLPMLAKQAPIKAAKVEPMQSFSLGKRRKKRDGWLMSFTWLVLFVVVGLTGAWWWQNHKAQQEEISIMADQTSGGLTSVSRGQAIELNIDNNSPAPAVADEPQAQTPVIQPAPSGSTAQSTAPVATVQQTKPVDNSQRPELAASGQVPVNNVQATLSPAPEAGGRVDTATPAGDVNALVMVFTADCWLEVSDATGKKLFSGIQRKDGKLNLTGQAPYKLKIGAPGAVQIQFQGKPVDLSRFIRANQVARLTVSAE